MGRAQNLPEESQKMEDDGQMAEETCALASGQTAHEKAAHIAGAYNTKIAEVHTTTSLKVAELNREVLLRSAKIGARARYFQGTATLIGAVGVLVGLVYRLREESSSLKTDLEHTRSDLEGLKQRYILLKDFRSFPKPKQDNKPLPNEKDVENAYQ
ncbi:hypothetical protein QOT17_024996 [Balamuthia mandrillaris]